MYVWCDDEEEAFQMLKLKLCSAPILSLPEGSEDFVVFCDASLKGSIVLPFCHLILILDCGVCIGDEIYSTVDACNTAKEMWTAIERLQRGESLNVQDVKTNLFWEFGKFTSRDGESMESYYSRFYKLMNELTRNNLQVSPMQVNVQFLQQLQPEWSRFVTVVKQRQAIDTVSYHKLFDVLKQF
ncbi:reverse transcriptase domain-containing protein [Tanacetum coccineum]